MTRAVLVLLAVTSAACSGTKRVGGQPSWRAGAKASADKPTGPITFVPKTEAATRYNERIQAPPKSPLSDAVILAVKDAATKGSMQVPVADARLFRACAEIAELTPEKSIVDNNVIEFVIQRHGIIEPTPHMLVVWGDINDAEVIVEQLRPRIVEILADGATARVGIGTAKRRADGTGAIVFALQASAVNTNPIPRSLARGGSFALDAVIESRYREPELFVTHDDGKTELLPIVIGKSGGFKATFQCGKHIGRQQVEITASDQAGPTVLANFPVWCGEEPPATITIDQSQEDNEDIAADEAERRVLALVNRDRLAAGFSTLLWDDKVAAVSRGHSEDMKKTKIVAHVSPTTGSAADRVRAAGL